MKKIYKKDQIEKQEKVRKKLEIRNKKRLDILIKKKKKLSASAVGVL